MVAHVRAELLDAEVWDFEEGTSAEDDGLFEFPSVPPGRYALRAFPNDPGCLDPTAKPVEVEAGAAGVELRVGRIATVRVEIVEADEDPFERGPADVSLVSASGSVVDVRYGAESAGGPLFFRAPAGAAYRVAVDCPGWRQEGTGEFAIAPGAARVDVAIPLRFDGGPAAFLEILVHDGLGQPVRRVAIGTRENRWPQRTRILEFGENGCRLRLSTGNWCVKIGSAPGDDDGGPWLTQVLDVDLGEGESLVREVELVRGGLATFLWDGRWWDGRTDLEVLEGPEVPEPSRDARYLLALGGPFVLAPGHWLVELRPPGVDPIRREFDLAPGANVEVDFR